MFKRIKTWIYHETEAPKIVFEDEAVEYYANGWADTPAKFFKMSNPGNMLEVQQVGEMIEGVKNQLNGALNLENMTKSEMVAYGKKHFNAQLSKRVSRNVLITELKGLIGLKETI